MNQEKPQDFQRTLTETSKTTYQTEKLANFPLTELYPHAVRYHNFMSYKDANYKDRLPTQPADSVTEIGRVDEITMLGLVHLGYLVCSRSVFDLWQKTEGRMRGTLDTFNDSRTMLFHQASDNPSEILDKAKSFTINRWSYWDIQKKLTADPTLVTRLYSRIRGSSDDPDYEVVSPST